MLKGIDYSFSRPNLDQIKSIGYGFVCRYVSGGNSKDITAGEVQSISMHGLSLVLVWEGFAQRALSGHAGGASDAQAAIAEAQNVGCGNIGAIYFAVDFDPSQADLGAITDYIAGATSVLGKDRTGVYGGFSTVKHCLDAGVCSYAWQTYAWSGGQWDSRAQLRQTLNGQVVAGGDVDIDESTTDNYGQWPPISNQPPMPNEIDTVVANKRNEFQIDGTNTVYSIFAVPSEDFFLNVLHCDFANVRHLPSDWPLDPKDWPAQRSMLASQLSEVNTALANAKVSYENLQAQYTAENLVNEKKIADLISQLDSLKNTPIVTLATTVTEKITNPPIVTPPQNTSKQSMTSWWKQLIEEITNIIKVK